MVLVAAKTFAVAVDGCDYGTYHQHNCCWLSALCVVAAAAVAYCCVLEHHCFRSCTAHSLVTWSQEQDNDAETTIVVFDYDQHHFCCCLLPPLPQFE